MEVGAHLEPELDREDQEILEFERKKRLGRTKVRIDN